MQRIPKNQYWFFYPFQGEEESLVIEGGMHIQISRVLRMQEGENLLLFNGRGKKAFYRIIEIQNKYSELERVEITSYEDRRKVSVFQVLPKKAQIEIMVEKAIALGVKEIIFFSSENTSWQGVSQTYQERLYRLMQQSMEQCGMPWMTNLYFFEGISQIFSHLLWNEKWANYHHYLLDSKGAPVKKEKEEAVGLWIGGEGGFSVTEIEQIKLRGALLRSLGEGVFKSSLAFILASYYFGLEF